MVKKLKTVLIKTTLRYKCGCKKDFKISLSRIDVEVNFASKVQCEDCLKL